MLGKNAAVDCLLVLHLWSSTLTSPAVLSMGLPISLESLLVRVAIIKVVGILMETVLATPVVGLLSLRGVLIVVVVVPVPELLVVVVAIGAVPLVVVVVGFTQGHGDCIVILDSFGKVCWLDKDS